MLPDLGRLTLKTEPTAGGLGARTKVGRLAPVEHAARAEEVLAMETLTCEVRYGAPSKHIPVRLKYESTDSVPRDFPVKGLVTTRVTFSFDAEEGDELSLDGIPDRFYFPALGLLPEWGGYPDMSPHEHHHWIPRPGDEDYDEDVEANEEEWNAVKDDEWKANRARGADNYEIVLDVRELARTPVQQLTNRGFRNIRNRHERFTTDSILFADHLMFVSCGAQTVLTDESRMERYEINDDASDDWSNHLNMPCKLKQLWVVLEFWHPPYQLTPSQVGMLEPVEHVTSKAKLMANVIALTNDGEFDSACRAAAAWSATHKGAKGDAVFWTAITERAFPFARLGVAVHSLSPEAMETPGAAKDWFFTLCGRANKMRGAQERLEVLSARILDRDNRIEVLRVQMSNAMGIGPLPGGAGIDMLRAELLSLQLNLHDPLHPGTRLEELKNECRTLLAWTKKALGAKPSDTRVVEKMLDHWQHVTTPSDPPLSVLSAAQD